MGYTCSSRSVKFFLGFFVYLFCLFIYCSFFVVVIQRLKHKTKKVFVGGVPLTMEEETIRKYFEKYGEVSINLL